mmetsp:Transcript_18217/g.57495  ORF Transcript_18217/g.57495 Transcript_18217/m.57495 type:complete len:278 (+) Transcript_18217:339-1172(+)
MRRHLPPRVPVEGHLCVDADPHVVLQRARWWVAVCPPPDARISEADGPPVQQCDLRALHVRQQLHELRVHAPPPAAAPAELARQVVPGAKGEDGHRGCVVEVQGVDHREDPPDRTVASTDEHAEAPDGSERLERLLEDGLAEREVDDLLRREERAELRQCRLALSPARPRVDKDEQRSHVVRRGHRRVEHKRVRRRVRPLLPGRRPKQAGCLVAAREHPLHHCAPLAQRRGRAGRSGSALAAAAAVCLTSLAWRRERRRPATAADRARRLAAKALAV